MKEMIYLLIFFILFIRLGSSAHFIIGYVEDGLDGELADGKEVTLWNVGNTSDNVTDIIGPTGNAGISNYYMIDCELLDTPCVVGDNLSVTVTNSLPYFSDTKNVTVTGFGFDVVENLTINSPIKLINITVEDDITSPTNQIDLTAGSVKNVTCGGVLKDFDGEGEIVNASSEFFDNVVSSWGAADDNNDHYTNTSCSLNASYGDATEVYVNCSYQIQYYANAENWNCTIISYDNSSYYNLSYDTTQINSLLAIDVDSPINFGTVNGTNVSEEFEVNITNYGNIEVNLSLSGYGAAEGDGYAMNCSEGNISIGYERYNLTNSTLGDITLSQFDQLYINLTSSPVIKDFGLVQRTNDTNNTAIKASFWRIYLPNNVANNCTGNIIFGAVEAQGT